MKADDKRHGTVAGYGAGCRDMCCKKAMSNYENRRRLSRMAGRDRLVPRAGAVRMLRSLQAIGWPTPTLSAELNRSRNYVSAFVSRTDNAMVRAGTYNEIADLYERLCMTRGPSSLTAARSVAAGWLPPLAYDDITKNLRADNKVDKYLGAKIAEDIDEVLVERILAGDFGLAKGANPAERRSVHRKWKSSTAELERLTGWNIHRDLRREAA